MLSVKQWAEIRPTDPGAEPRAAATLLRPPTENPTSGLLLLSGGHHRWAREHLQAESENLETDRRSLLG